MAAVKMLPALKRREEKSSYRNFNVSVYCVVGTIREEDDLEEYRERFRRITDHVNVGRVYIENFRSSYMAPKELILKIKKMFEEMGIDTAGGITTCAADNKKDGFVSMCYSNEEHINMVREAVKMNAGIFDEFIFDDYYFDNCRCEKCVREKGNRTWSEFRLARRKWVTEEVVMKTAKEVNPEVNVIVKYPQWFEDFNECGYDLKTDTEMFDSIYTGTETRNPSYCQQHLPKYLSYNTMRLYGSDRPGSNLGGWFDPFECNYNLTSYLEQGYLTLFAKAKEAMIFCNGCFTDSPEFRSFMPALGAAFKETDDYLGKLGNPVGVMAYHPSNGRGENNVHSYLGQCGIPMEMCLLYPENARDVFLAESAADDYGIVEKMQKTLFAGGNVIVTSGFVRKLGDRFLEFANIRYSTRKAIVKDYCVSWNHGVGIGGKYAGSREVMIPQLDYCTNDVWEMAGGFGTDNNFPVVLRFAYAAGNVSVITIPDDMGDLYNYPAQVLNVIRSQFYLTSAVKLKAPAGVQLFLYDNDTLIIRSDLPYAEVVSVEIPDGYQGAEDLVTGRKFTAGLQNGQDRDELKNEITFEAPAGINLVWKLIK